MTKHSLDFQAERLQQLSAEVSRIAGSLAEFTFESADHNESEGAQPGADNRTPADPDVSADSVSWVIGARRQRGRYLSEELFADPAWDMLLDLFHAEVGQRKVCVSSLCIASGVPQTTALRWLKELVEQGLVTRRSDPVDGRRVYVELAPHVSKALRRYFVDVIGGTPRRHAVRKASPPRPGKS
jgi:DNA-binding transcriptional ArsR family regulator